MEALTQAAHDHDVEALLACLSPTVIVRSPITQRIRFVGIDEAAHLFRQVFAVVSDVGVYETVGEGDRTQAIFWRGRFRPATIRAALGTISAIYRSGERSLVRLTGAGMTVPPEEQKPAFGRRETAARHS